MQLGKKENPIDPHFEDMPEQELFLRIRDDMLHSRTGINLEEQLSKGDPEKLIQELNGYITRMYRISEGKIKRFDDYIKDYIFNFHVLSGLMRAKDISDIKVLAWDNVRIKQLGKRKSTDVKFWSPEDFRGSVEMFAVKNGINLGNVNAIQTFTDKRSSEDFIYRFNISTGAINSTGEPYLHIRKIPKEKKTVSDLIDLKMLDEVMAEYLNRRRDAGYVIICGENGSGKTYLQNALLEEIPWEESVLVVQENEELFSHTHPDMMFQHIAVRRGDKKIHYSLKELVINGLLTDIDHIVIGEIKGEEALYFITAALAGCHGMTTIHSMNAAGALDKLADYSIKRIKEGNKVKDSIPISLNRSKHPKLATMLFIGHTGATAVNAGKVYFTKNPLAINYPQWMDFAKYSYKQLRWAVIQKPAMRDAYVEEVLNSELKVIFEETDALFEEFCVGRFVVFE